MGTKQSGGGSAKIGRHKRAKSNALQSLRSERNKRLRIERDAVRLIKTAKRKSAKKIVRGATRRIHRLGLPWKAKTVEM